MRMRRSYYYLCLVLIVVSLLALTAIVPIEYTWIGFLLVLMLVGSSFLLGVWSGATQSTKVLVELGEPENTLLDIPAKK